MTDETSRNDGTSTGDDHMGAVEGDTAVRHAAGECERGRPWTTQGCQIDPLAICEDVIGANVDGSEGG